MNHPIDTEDKKVEDPEPCASPLSFEFLRMVSEVEPLRDSERSRTVSTLSLSKGRSADSKHLKLLETLIDKIIKRLEDNSCQPKIRDALKAIKLKQELSEAKSVGVVKTSEAEKMFWEEIEAIRRCELRKLYPEPTSLQAQIQATILGLKDLVKNGILPLKTVTDAFNQGRSKQGRFTYRRMARLLSAMGFTKAKTPNGCSAIIWDDELLPEDTSSEAHDPSTQEG